MPESKPEVAFVCPRCRRRYGDPWYHGPVGHAPTNLCADCWCIEWERMVEQMHRGGDWSELDSALALLCRGFSYDETARILGRCGRTIRNWIQRLRRQPEKVPDWLSRLRGAARRHPSAKGEHDV